MEKNHNEVLEKKKENPFILAIKGKADKKIHGIFFIIVLTYFGVSLLMAQILYPGGYSITQYFISRQGHPIKNPIGSWFFIFGTCISSILLIPHFLYMHRRMMPTLGLVTKLMTLTALIGCFGLFMVGVFPEGIAEIGWLHDIGADLAFGGLGVSALLSMFVMIRKLVLKEEKPGVLGFLLIYGVVFGLAVVIILTTNSIQQWFGLFTVLAWVILTFILM